MELALTLMPMEIGLTVVILIVIVAMVVAHLAGRSRHGSRSRPR